jgi:hypothetical protein
MDNAAISREPDVPSWSNAALEDHKGFRLHTPGTPAFFAKGTRTFFGDVHIHTNYSRCGHPNNMELAEKLAYSREAARLDFVAVADHAEHMDDAQYAAYCAAIDAADAPGAFVALPAYEWAGRGHPSIGHRNVMFRDGFGPIFRGNDPRWNIPRTLAEALRRTGLPLMAPRHHTTYHSNWNTFEPDLEPVVEIYSSWGNSECAGGAMERSADGANAPWPGHHVQDGLIRGYRMGFVAGGDAHCIKPGTAGITGVVAPALTRPALWDAIHARRCYATTGAKILLDFLVNGFPMGSVIAVPAGRWKEAFPLRISCAAVGTAPLARIELIENNRAILTQQVRRGPANEMAFCVVRREPTYYWRYYYARLTQVDGEMAWSHPIWLVYAEEGF